MKLKAQRNGALDFYKFIFSVIIVIFHGKNLMAEKVGFLFLGGSIGVDFFFLVSGCMMAASASRRRNDLSLGKDTFEFMKHKILGLCPNVYVAWVIAFSVTHMNVKSLYNVLEDGMNSMWELLFMRQTGLLAGGGKCSYLVSVGNVACNATDISAVTKI